MKNMIIIGAIATILFSCKKESTVTSVDDEISESIHVAFVKQIELTRSKNGERIPFANETEILWDKGLNVYEKKIVLFPIRASNSNEPLNASYRYLQASLNNKNEVTSFEYLLVSKRLSKKITSVGISDVAGMLDDKTIIRYGLDNLQKLNDIRVSKPGALNNPISTKIKRDENTSSVLQIPEGCSGYIIDWYWTTWDEYGNVISEEYMYSTQFIYCPPSGGGGGGGGTGNTNCSTTAINNFMNQGGVESGPIGIGNISGTAETGINLRYNWLIFRAGTWGLLSYEKATYVKVYYSSSNTYRYEYTAFTHERIAEAGFLVGIGTRTFQDLGATINISPTRMMAEVTIDFTVISSICGSSSIQPFNAFKRFYTTSNVSGS